MLHIHEGRKEPYHYSPKFCRPLTVTIRKEKNSIVTDQTLHYFNVIFSLVPGQKKKPLNIFCDFVLNIKISFPKMSPTTSKNVSLFGGLFFFYACNAILPYEQVIHKNTGTISTECIKV